jgi:hypothetical protein
VRVGYAPRAEEAPLAVAVEVRFGLLGWLAASALRKSLCKDIFELAGKLIQEGLFCKGG